MFLDTSGLFLLMNSNEARHSQATSTYAATAIRVTHSYILVELSALAIARRVNQQPVLRFVEAFWPTPELMWSGSMSNC